MKEGFGSSLMESDARARARLARLAHELKTPLGAIVVLAEIMRDERIGPLGTTKYRIYAADIHQSASHANAVIQAFLDPDVSEGAEGGPLEFVELDLGGCVKAAVSALAPLADRLGVHLCEHIDPGLPHLIADRRSVVQILNNLVTNAMKFTPPGGRVEVEVRYDPGGPVVLGVTDTGDGMSEADVRRVSSDTIASEPLRRRSGGTGIGLPLVRALAAAGGATLSIDSSIGRGTRAAVCFPHDRVVPV